MDILRFICSTIVLICTGVVLSGDTIVITDTAFVIICTDAVSYYGCLHLVWLGVSDTIVSRFFIKKFYRNLKILRVTMGDRKEVTFCSGFLFFGFPFFNCL